MSQTTTVISKRSALNNNATNYILSVIDPTNYNVVCASDRDKVNFVMSTFESEYLHHNNRNGNKVTLFAEYLSGLPSCINVEFRNYSIIEIAKLWESITHNATEKQEDKIISNWFNFISNKFFQLHRKLNK